MKLQEEEKLQIECVRWFRRTYPHLKCLLHHSPNEGKRGWFDRIKLNRMGLVCGFPDLILLLPSGKTPFLCMELKSKKGRLSAYQNEFWKNVTLKSHAKYVIIKDLEQFKILICQYLNY